MPLPGKLTIGFLQEDNPQKSFFRFKPVFVKEDQRYRTIEETVTLYPEDGYIRIVPDKNEINQFKARMRQIGTLCLLDLRKYPYENNKIRPNKNYSKDGLENNAFIVYSDVICQAPLSAVIEVVDVPEASEDGRYTLTARAPLTQAVAIRINESVHGPFEWSVLEGEADRIALTPMEDKGTFELSGEALGERLLSAECEDGEVHRFVYDLSEVGMLDNALENDIPEHGALPGALTAPAKAADAAVEADAHSAAMKADGQTEPAPPERSGEPQEEKPWLHRDESIMPRALSRRLSLREQAIQAQSGINPRRGRSLSEVVDEQWRKSRIDQLGHPVPANTAARPMMSPIELAVTALKDAWRYKDARMGLISGVLNDKEIAAALRVCFSQGAHENVTGALEESLNELEATRLQLIAEIDALRGKRSEMRKALMAELKTQNKRELADFEERKSKLQSEIAENERAAEQARKEAEEARRILERIFDEQFDEKLIGHVTKSRACDLLARMAGEKRPAAPTAPALYEPAADGLFADVHAWFQKAGYEISNEEVVNLLAILAVGDMIVISGEPGSGKSGMVKTLAAAMGLTASSAPRFACVRRAGDEKAKNIMDTCGDEVLSILMIDNLNVSDTDEPLEEAMAFAEQAAGLPLRVVATVQDAPDGRPLPVRLLERAFFVRLEMPSLSESWKPREKKIPDPQYAVSREALRRVFAEKPELPMEIEARMASLRAALGEIGWSMSRRTLDGMWRYCAAVIPYMQGSPLMVLDRALAQRALPAMLAGMELDALHALKGIFSDMPRCLKLMDQRLPLPPL